MIYLDNAASSFPKPQCVYKAMYDWIRSNGANAGRSGHKLSYDAGILIYQTRELISEIFGIKNPENISLVPNATYGLNMLIQGLLKDGDHVITTELEHNSVLRPLYKCEKRNVSLSIAKVDLSDDDTTIQNILSLINSKTKLIVCTQCSNVCGKIMPIKELSKRKPENIKLLVDGSQGAGVIPINIQRDGIDYYCAPSHKSLYGPQGAGFVAVCSTPPEPLLCGGTGSDSFNKNQPEAMPDLLECGTLPTPVIAGFKKGLEFVNKIGVENIFEYKKRLIYEIDNSLSGIERIIRYNDYSNGGFVGAIAFNISGTSSEKIASYLADNQICVRGGIHCAPLYHLKMNTEDSGMVRVSPGLFNTEKDINRFIKVLNNYKNL